MTLLLGLARYQCRSVALIGLTGWSVVLVIALMAELAAGADPAWVLRGGHVAVLAVVLLPEVLQVCLPLSVLHCLHGMAEGGELLALRAAGVRPWFVAVAVLLPVVPLLFVLDPLVHATRPAALAAASLCLVSPQQVLWRGARRHGIGVVPVGDGLHALLPVGEQALAVTADGVTARGFGVELTGGIVRVVGRGKDVTGGDARFRRAELRADPYVPGLAEYTEKQLSTSFLSSQSVRWRTARTAWHGRRSGELVHAELNRRDLVVPAVAISLLFSVLLLWSWRPLSVVVVYGGCAPIALGIGVFLPRVLA